MSEKILYSDLFEEDILAKIGELSKGIHDFQGEISKIKSKIQGDAIELKIRLSQEGLNANQIQALANDIDKLSKAIKILDDAQLQASKASVVAEKALQEQLKTEQQREKLAQQQLRTEQQRAKQQQENNKLRAEEQETLKRLQADLNILTQRKANLLNLDKDSIKYAETQAQSYNLLSASYNAVKNALNRFSEEERKGIPVLANMEKQAKAMYEQMNKLQQATGKHTLNVGNYQSAFDGLGWSVRNVVRELPALGINLNTFFLAISNNIPIVIDEIKRFNEEQKKVAEAIKNGTAEAGTQVQSVGKKIISTVLSWQTLLIVGITILTKYGKQIGEWVVGLFRAKEAVDNLISSQEALNKVKIQVLEETKDEEVELKLILSRLKDVKQGTDEWRNAIERVNEITDANLSTTTATIGQVEEVTKAYLEQAIQLAKNQAIIDQISESERNKIKRGLALKGKSGASILSVLGIEYYDKEGEISEVGKEADEYVKALENIENQRQKLTWADQVSYEYLKEVKSSIRDYEKTIVDFENYIRNQTQLLDEQAIDDLLKEYKILAKNDNDSGGRKGREKTKKDYEDLWRELAEIRVEAMKEGYEKELEAERLANKLFLHDIEQKYNEELAKLKYNNEHKFISDKEYLEESRKLKAQYDKIKEYQETVHAENIFNINAEYNKQIEDERLKALEKEIDAIEKRYDIEEKYIRKRSRNESEEKAKNLQILRQIEAQNNAIKEYIELREKAQFTSEIDELNEKIRETENTITSLKSKLTIDKRNNINPITQIISSWLQKPFEKMNEGELKREFSKYLQRELNYSEAEANEMAENINVSEIFEKIKQWAREHAEDLQDYGRTAMGYISDLIDSYVDLADAKLEAAEAGVDAAQEAYDKEQALLEAGYANSVETAWAELEEQKKIMKQAEEEKKKAQKVQLALDTAQQASSMVTAVAEVFKNFAETPWLAGIMASMLVSSFIASKAMAMQAVNYGDGTVELLDYGGSHASGQDMPLATDRRGRTRRVEKGEAFAVFNKRAVKRHGYSKIKSIVDGINKGTYEDRALADVERNLTLGMMYEQNRVDLTKVENTLSKVAENTGKQIYRDQNGNLVEINGNVKRVYKA